MYHFIVNPSSSSGRGAVLWKEIEKTLIAEQVPYLVYTTEGVGSAMKFAEDITQTDEEVTIVVCGGDGTMNEVVSGIRDYSKVILGCIPTGSSNDLIRDLGFPKDPMAMLEVILHPNRIVPMDIGRLTYTGGCKNFSVSMGIGFDAAICHEALHSKIKDALNKIKLGKLTYLGIALKQLAGTKKIAATITLDDEKVIHVDRILFVTGMIHRYEGGGFKFCPDAVSTDGILNLFGANDLHRMNFFRIFPTAYDGNHLRFKGLFTEKVRKISIKSVEPLWVHTDGEVLCKSSHITVDLYPHKLQLLI